MLRLDRLRVLGWSVVHWQFEPPDLGWDPDVLGPQHHLGPHQDTNDSLADFTSGPFAYQNNASPPTDTPCAPPVSTTPAPSPTGQRAAALKKCKKKQGKKARKKCKRKASLLPV